MSEGHEAAERKLVSYRTMDIVVAGLFLVVSAIVIADSLRLGINWRPNEGPAPGYFPFYIAVVMALASVFNLVRALPRTEAGAETLVTGPGLKRMAAVFAPAVVFVFATAFIGIYVSATIYIAAFMIAVGKFPWWQAAAVALGIAIVNFMMFEVWFLVPLPKGPLETALGY
ncbi:MAG: tripartite tricarboxylate transporter TctB family protein [Rhizobiales bacterium]|nr:tripartite tricarboxylate transporter TctB family protein [Hyphomicrobiales bacterium]